MQKLTDIGKNIAYQLGLLSMFHRFRNRDVLTIAMFHRVLPPTDPHYTSADPEWTMTPTSFNNCLQFFKKHYSIVSPQDVFDAIEKQAKLPDRSLLVTFDDGWADTAKYAQPILKNCGVSALVFVAGGAVNQNLPFWEERVYGYLASNPQSFSQLASIFALHGITLNCPTSSTLTEVDIRNVIRELSRLDPALVELATRGLNVELPRAMLNSDELNKLVNHTHVVGAHGMTHRPLTKVENINDEVSTSAQLLSGYLAGMPVVAMSFPHGAYSQQVVNACRTAGYRYLFTSSPHLNSISKTKACALLGRIHVSEREIIDANGCFKPDRLATWLFLRSRAGGE